MKEEIIKNLDNARQLENLYRYDKSTFKSEFNLIYPDIQEKLSAQIWYERLNYENEKISWGRKQELIFVLIASFLAGLIAKIPDFTSIDHDYFYQRNISFIIFPFLTLYFAWRLKINFKKITIILLTFLISVAYINLLPVNAKSDTILLAIVHLPLFLWTVLGYIYTGNSFNNFHSRLEYLRFNGDLIIMTSIILLSGALLTGITIGLFALIQIDISDFYFRYVVVWGLAASPIVSTFLVQSNPQLVNKISPIIAIVFTPLVLTTLIVFLIALIKTGQDPYNDREFLFILNFLLISVMAIILFSITEIAKLTTNTIGWILLISLTALTIIVNGLALSAILFRISEWGLTPNRLAVLGANLLIMLNLLFVIYGMYKTTLNKNELIKVEKSIASFLPIYSLWALIVTFLFPLLFNFN